MMRHADALGHQHLGNRLAETAVADDDGARLGRDFGPFEIARALSSRRSSQSVRRIRKGVVAIDSVTTAPNSEAASGVINWAVVAWREEDETEFAGLAQQQAEPDASRPIACRTCAASPPISMALVTMTPIAMPMTNNGRAAIELQVEQHPDRQEEQSEQDRAERLDIAFKLVPIGRFGEHDAGDEGAQRNRQMQRVHQPPPRRRP